MMHSACRCNIKIRTDDKEWRAARKADETSPEVPSSAPTTVVNKSVNNDQKQGRAHSLDYWAKLESSYKNAAFVSILELSSVWVGYFDNQ